MKTDEKIRLYPDQLRSLSDLRPLLKPNRRAVLDAIIKSKEQETLNCRVTFDEIHELTGISYRTISRCISEFINAGLLRQWPIDDGSWCRYLILPVADRVFQFYRDRQNRKSKSRTSGQTIDSTASNATQESEHPVDAATSIVSGSEAGAVSPKKHNDKHQKPVDNETLDPKISTLIDELLEKQVWSAVPVEYFISQGMVPFQISSDQKLKIDKDAVHGFLRARNLNSYAEFISRLDEFWRTPEARPPCIDLPSEENGRQFSVKRWLGNKLADHMSGFYWVWDHIKVGSPDDPEGYLPFEHEYRTSFIQFMRKYKLQTLDDVIEKAKSVSAEIEAQRAADQK